MDADYSDHTPSVKSLWSLTSEVKTVALLVKKIKPMVLIRLFILYKSWPAVWSSSRFTWGREDPRHVRTTMEPRCKSQMEARGRPPFKPRKTRSCDVYCFVFRCRGEEVLLDNSRISNNSPPGNPQLIVSSAIVHGQLELVYHDDIGFPKIFTSGSYKLSCCHLSSIGQGWHFWRFKWSKRSKGENSHFQPISN